MGNAHVAGKVYCALAVVKDLGGHAIAFALKDPTSRTTGRDTTSILTTVLKIVQALVQIGRGVRRIGIRKDKGENTTHFCWIVWNKQYEYNRLDGRMEGFDEVRS